MLIDSYFFTGGENVGCCVLVASAVGVAIGAGGSVCFGGDGKPAG